MPSVNTVLGAIHPEEMGITAMHTQVLSACPGWVSESEWWRYVPRLFGKWDKDLADYKELGGGSVVASLGVGMKHDMEVYRLLSRATGIHIIASTGFWGERGASTPLPLRDIDSYTEFFFDELTQGIGKTKARAGVIEIRIPQHQMTAVDEITLRAAARVVKRTGCCLMIYGIFTARRQVDILMEEGTDPSRIVIGDCDDARGLELERDKEFCRKGFHVGYTHIGSEPTWMVAPHVLSDFIRADLVKAMVEAGFIDQLIISAGPDSSVSTGGQWATPYSGVTVGTLLHFIPKLYRVFLTDDDIDKILIGNPKRLLPF
jgi:phosphotriesterase-related protein